MIVVPNAASLAMLAELVGVGNLLNGALVMLFQNDITPTRDTLLAELTPADFTGYAASAAVTWSAPFLDDTGEAVTPGDLKEFVAGSPILVSNTIYGYAVTNGAGDTLLWAERFDAPVFVSVAGKTIAVLPIFGAVSQT